VNIIDRVTVVIGTAAAPLLSVLVYFHVLDAGGASVIGGFIAAVIAGYHGNAAVNTQLAKGKAVE